MIHFPNDYNGMVQFCISLLPSLDGLGMPMIPSNNLLFIVRCQDVETYLRCAQAKRGCMPSVFFSIFFVDLSNQSCLLIIDCVVLPGVVSAKGPRHCWITLHWAGSWVYLRRFWRRRPSAGRLQHLPNVALTRTALCICENSSFLSRLLHLSVYCAC